ncbi:kinase [Trinickia caryophylli]|uniref:D-glycero-alpha-D-manno-heptose-7-phosphate kinase n=1 Tax=Trinickia caryophylli TaxID=28094 RepID=A0A1X7CNC4_TRICW|nr:kinase [Trinickia caryophylli]PMS11261.1 kinase [Trinickia caryophylli]TRX20114.1 kinase [Trinickia caryophylli]WQE12536.1 kinase [Trinickia caryophylli]SME99879.1 D-glycero-alpha-D-manno-heptose-7-phosphate kinase [Trinickia caryophylli]GLU30221.1 GHMP kinase [Trinickia caryophylli]
MIITRTPFRISFLGGGTDYPAWFQEHGGAVVATTINKYCYISCRRLPPFFEHKHRVVYSRIENVVHNDEIQHPAVRAVLNWARVEDGLEIHHDGDLPARSGLGSSSSFTVGLVHALYGLRGRMVNKDELAKDAIFIEQQVMGEHVGSQDQISAAFGGFNRIEFHRQGSFEVVPVLMPPERRDELRSHLMLCFTGFSRLACEVAKSKIDNMKNRETELKRMREMVDEGIAILQDPRRSIDEFGTLLDASWRYKRRLSDRVSTPEIDRIYDAALTAGATGGKILGAGGGGFLLLFAKPERQAAIRERLKHLVHVPFDFEDSGSRVVVYQPNGL